MVLKECNAAVKRSGFKSIELLQVVVLKISEFWRAGWPLRLRKFSGRRWQRDEVLGSRCVFFVLDLLVVLRRVVIFMYPRTQAYHN